MTLAEESTPCSGQVTLLNHCCRRGRKPWPHTLGYTNSVILRTTTLFSTQLSADSGLDGYRTTALALHLPQAAISASLRIHRCLKTRTGSSTLSRSTKTMKQQDQTNWIRLWGGEREAGKFTCSTDRDLPGESDKPHHHWTGELWHNFSAKWKEANIRLPFPLFTVWYFP